MPAQLSRLTGIRRTLIAVLVAGLYGAASAQTAQVTTTTNQYDAQGNLKSVKDPLGNTTTYAYDALNRRVSGLDANNGNTVLGYDLQSHLTSVQDPRALTTTYQKLRASLPSYAVPNRRHTISA